MAISGFHFSLIASLLGLMLRPLFRQRTAYMLLMALICLYFLFLGPGASILRAFTTIGIALAAGVIGRPASGINALGAAAFLLLLYDPLLLATVGFPFSVLTTASILMLYPTADRFLKRFFRERTMETLATLPKTEKIGYYLMHHARQAFALTLAVNAIALPMTLYFFGVFPLLSILYNLFFPFLVSVAMALLLFALLLPPLAPLLFHINSGFTHSLLASTHNLPPTFDKTLQLPEISPLFLLLWLLIFFYLAIGAVDLKAPVR